MQMLENHVVLITGGGSGLGLGLARYFRSEGAQLAILEVSADKVDDLQDEFGDDVLVMEGDVRDVATLTAMREAIIDCFGRLDAVVGCQGIADSFKPLMDTATTDIEPVFTEVFSVNVLGYILTGRVFFELLAENDGAFVMTASTAAFAADGGGLFYTASKGAVRSVVNQLAFEFAPRVRVNGVAPSGIANSQLAGPKALGLENKLQSDIPKEDFLREFKELMLLQHLPTPEEHGPLYAFLASHHNTLMTGQTVVADQGLFNRAVLSRNPVDR